MKIIRKGIVRDKPEEIAVKWMGIDEALNKHKLIHPLCDLCNKEIDWDPFPIIDYPSDEELADPDYVPIGGNALCKTCATKEYGLEENDAGKVNRLWVCFDVAKFD